MNVLEIAENDYLETSNNNLENINFNDKTIKLNRYSYCLMLNLISPRSLEACKRLGIEIKDLYSKSFSEFKNNNPEVRLLPLQIQELRYAHSEKYREKLISTAQEVM